MINWNNKDDILNYIKKETIIVNGFFGDKKIVKKSKEAKDKLYYGLFTASYELKNDKDFLLEVIKFDLRNIIHVADHLMDNKDFIISLLKVTEYHNRDFIFEKLSNKLKGDREFIISAVSIDGDNLKYASKELQNDKEVVLEALKETQSAFKYAPDELQNDMEVALKTSKEAQSAFEYASDELRNDREFILTAVKYNAFILRYLSKELQNDREIILTAVSTHPRAVNFLPEEYIYDREVVLTSLNQVNGDDDRFPLCYNYERLPENLKEDKEIIITFINAAGKNLFRQVGYWKNCQEIIKKFEDKNLTLAILKNVPKLIEVLPDEIKQDKKILLELIKEPETLHEISKYLDSSILEEVIQEYLPNKQSTEEYLMHLLNNITASQNVFNDEQNDCVNYIHLLKEYNTYDRASKERRIILEKMQLSPCYQSYLFGTGQYEKYRYEIVSSEVKEIFKICKELLGIYSRKSNNVIDFYINDGYDIIKKSLIQYLYKKDQISLYDRIICETLVSNILKQIQLLQIGILSKNDEKLNDTIKLFDELLTSDLNQLKNYSINQKTEIIDNKKYR